jgi:hypothetical protein
MSRAGPMEEIFMRRVAVCCLIPVLIAAAPARGVKPALAFDSDAVCSMVTTTMANRTPEADDALRAWDSAAGYFMAVLVARYPDDAQLKSALAQGGKQIGADMTPWISSCLKKYLDGSKRFKAALSGTSGR